MKFVDDFLAQRRVQALRSARSLDEVELRRLQDELVAMGPSAITPLCECLSHAEGRAPALEVLERLVSDATIDPYIELLASANPVVASAASRILASSRRYDARRILRALGAPSAVKPVLEPILREQIAFIPAADVAAILPTLPRDGQVLLLKILERAADGVVVSLLPLLRHEDPWLRAHLARVLSAHRVPGVVPALTGLLRDGAKAVRLEAVTALHALDAREAVPDLIGSLEDTDLQVQSAAIDALRDLGDDQAVPRLVQVLTHESEHVRRGAVEVLNEVATAEAIQDLVRVLGDADWWVRVRAADALGALGGKKVVRAVAGLMKDVDDAIRRHAIEILNAVPDPWAVPTLIDALDDADWWVRERAIDALGKTRDPRAVEPLLALLEREDGAAALCLRALGAIGDPRALRPITLRLAAEAPDVCRGAQAALQDFPRGDLGAEDRNLLNEALARTVVPAPHSTDVPLRVRGTQTGEQTPGASSIRGVRGSIAPPTPVPQKPAGAYGLNFADLAEGQELLERYRIVRRIGRGGFGTVYLALDRVIEEEIILKILNPQLSMDETAAQRFVQELKLARRISHRNVIRIHDFLDLGGTRAISMEYFPGRDLGQLLNDSGPLDVARGLRLASRLCEGLAAAHAVGVLHRDIKPANILVGDEDETRLVDFGMASAQQASGEGSGLTKSGLLIGTPEYMAPEQITGESVDHRVDLYSLGVVMYECLSGARPFTAETPVKVLFQHLEGASTPLRELIPGLPEAVGALIGGAIARDPNDRPAGAIELRDAIDRVLGDLAVGR